jgi:hypothetical protein
VRRVRATHYRAIVRLDGRRVPISVWVDADGLVLRHDLAVDGASFSVFFDYGPRPAIRTPSARFVADAG